MKTFPGVITALTLLAVIDLTGIPLVMADSPLPDIGQSGASLLTPAEERRTGEAVVRNIRQAGGIIEDPQLTDYINYLGAQLLPYADNPDQNRFQFFIVDDNSINAFALPGGFIGVNYGLILASESESELASVIAHEIAHVTQRHYARAYEHASNTQLPVLAALIAAIILGSKGNELGQAAVTSAAAGTLQQQINFTRHNEEEADRIGIQLLAKAGFDATAMAGFFDKLDKQSRLQGENVPNFLRSHPVNTQRITDAQSRAAQYPKAKPRDTLSYQLMRQRLLALTASNPETVLAQCDKELNSEKNPVLSQPSRYGEALLLIRLKKYAQAENEIHRLLNLQPQRIAYLLADAEILAKNNRLPEALNFYESILKLYPTNAAIIHDYVAALLRAQRADTAKNVLTQYMKTNVPEPEFFQYLAQAESMLNNPASSHEALAEYYYATGQYHQSLDQIQLALKLPRLDFYTASRLEARAQLIKQEIPASNPSTATQN
ncbi:MAG: M48 family metallopeptidase [Gammaproteobacteria bacterium]|nr:M48 family metallopeptidase [Gammaproteobacteria bacterium]